VSALWIRIGAVVMAIGVMAGAFGAHGLEEHVTPDRLDTWQTAARYQLIHGLALCGVGLLPRTPRWIGALFLAGVVVFSGSLYALVLTDVGVLGAITPLGGVAFIAGWVGLAVKAPKLVENTK
jgi:uncharacterized membrane protein YgdD (TMEM256/DUF423 family)